MGGINSTLLQLLDTFQNISKNHAFINDFFVGTDKEVTQNKRNYPLMWIAPDTINTYETYKEYSFRMYIMDQEQRDNSNRYEIQSNSDATITDVLIALRDVYDLRVKWGKQIVTYEEWGNDYCAGAYYDVIIGVPVTYGMNDFPVKQIVSNNELIDSDGTYFGDENDNKLESFNLQ